MRRVPIILCAGALLLLAACAEESEWDDALAGTLDSSGGAAGILDPSKVDGDEAEGDAAEEPGVEGDLEDDLEREGYPDLDGQAGDPCTAKEECLTDYCMTTENIGGLVKGAVVPGGYCSALFCAVDGSDGACTPAMGGLCFSIYPFFGATFGDKGICLAPCEDDADCRPEDDIVCLDAQDWVDEGLMDAAVLEQYYAGGSKGCLPQSVIDSAEEKLTGK